MEELKQLKDRLHQQRPAPWEGLPDIPLYMDQIISYMPRQLVGFGDGERLTPAMVNNYIKDGLLPRADGKKYNRTHLAHLTAICALKQVLSVKEIKALLGAREEEQAQALYHDFTAALDEALEQTADGLDDSLEREQLGRLALVLALRSYADKLACQRILDLLCPQEQAAPKKDSAKHTKNRREET